MNFSTKTKTTINRQSKQPSQDLYPDRSATDLTTKGDAVLRLPFDKVPRTTSDISAAMKWKHKDGEIYGTHAKADKSLENYRNDINDAYGKEDDYKYYFIDTFKSDFYDQFVEMKKDK